MATVLPVTERRIQLTAAGGIPPANSFPYNWRIFEDEDLDVFLTPLGQEPNDDADKLTLLNDYTVQGANNAGGGTVTIEPTLPNTGDIITIQSAVEQSQLVDFKVGGPFDPETVEFVIDKLTILVQENRSLILDLGLSYDTTRQLDKSSARGDNRLPQLPPSSSGVFPVWTKNAQGELIAGELREADDCSTLRGELADKDEFTPGAELVGYFNTGLTPNANTVNGALNFILSAIIVPGTLPQVSDTKFTFQLSEPGWLVMDDGTIGNATSGASNFADPLAENLFVVLWNNVSDANAPVSGGRGATAIDDFNSNKTLRLPLSRGRVVGATGTGAGLTARVLGDSTGVETHQLTEPEMPLHNHSITFKTGTETALFASPLNLTTHPSGSGLTTGTKGNDEAHQNMQPTTFRTELIRYLG